MGQNVNSYRDLSETTFPVSVSYPTDQQLSRGFTTIYKSRQGGRRFADLLDKVSLVSIYLYYYPFNFNLITTYFLVVVNHTCSIYTSTMCMYDRCVCIQVDPEMRIRFTSPHPKDFPDEVIRESQSVCVSTTYVHVCSV